MFAIGALGGVLGALLAPRLLARWSPWTVVLGTAWMWAAGIALLNFLGNPVAVGLILACLFLPAPVCGTAMAVYIGARAPTVLRGRVVSAGSMLSSVANPVGSLGVGVLLQQHGIAVATGALSTWMCLVGCAVLASRGMRQDWLEKGDGQP
jgi:hypothetical protein